MFSRVGAAAYKPGLDLSLNLSRFFGDPHKRFKSIHIAGTNGKGSTSHMIASVLQSQGYKVGLYTSPHLMDFRERIRINGLQIPKERVVKFVEDWQATTFEGSPSFFELTMQLAFNWFAEEWVDYAVIEVGMGGRLDSTNIISPILSVITNISWDHNQFLGDTLEKIAAEKAGIIKTGVPVVVGETQEESSSVFIDKAQKSGAELIFADQVSSTLEIKECEEGLEWQHQGINGLLPLGGEYQKKNLVTVLTALNRLRNSGVVISDESIREGISKVTLQTGLTGRWMIISKQPLTITDTGHNIAGLSYNFSQLYKLSTDKGYGKLHVVIGFVADKSIDKILDILPRDAEYYLTNAQIPRALPADKLWEKFNEKGMEGKIFHDVDRAYKEAKRKASEKDIIFIGGSTFVVADFLSALNSNS